MTEQLPIDEPMTRVDPPKPEPTQNDYAQTIAVIQRWRRILAIRWLALFALIGAVAVWGYASIDPVTLRLIVAAGYSLGVLIPTFFLYHLRSD